jgi:predicted DNA-binding transcriptional regulator AlpA
MNVASGMKHLPTAIGPSSLQPASSAPQSLLPLAVDIRGLATLLQRSVASLHRDNAAGRLPAAVKIGASVRWIVRHVELWLEWGAPSRDEFAVRLAAQHQERIDPAAH